jgi:hypothetical protein
MPAAVSEMAFGEFPAVLVMVTVPVALAIAAGAKVTFKVAVCAGVRVCPLDTPLAVKPVPEMPTFTIVMLEAPALVSVTGRILLLPVLTLPKFRLAGLTLSRGVPPPAPATILTFVGGAGARTCAESDNGVRQRARTSGAE